MMTTVFERQQNSNVMCCDWPIWGSVHLPAGYEEDMNMLDNSDHNENTLFISVSKHQVTTLVEGPHT